MSIVKRMRTLIAGCVIAGLAAQVAAQSAEDAATESSVALDDLRVFARVFEQIRQVYVDKIDDPALFDMAIRGMLLQLDPHSEYLNLEKQEVLRESTTGQFLGIGVELSMEDGDLTVVAPLDNTPASRAGILSGDIIVRINGEPVQGLSMAEALNLLQSKNQGRVELTLFRPATRSTLEIELEREVIALESVSSRVIAGDIGYIRISQFQNQTGSEFVEALEKFNEQDIHFAGYVIDLRNNPGGLLQSSVEVVDALIDSGLFVSTRGRYEGFNTEFRALPGAFVPNMPLIVLTNRGTASAAEIVAGALQDHGRALVLGDISFGKGSVQNVINIDESRTIKLTTARYYTPSGRSIQAQGIIPDVIIEEGAVDWQPALTAITEANLARHLSNEQSDKDEPQLVGSIEGISDIVDVQLAHAISLLKGNRILNSPSRN